MKNDKTLEEKEKEIVIARLKVLVPEMCFASGSDFKSFTRDEIISEIKQNSEVGREFVETEMEFLRALKNGSLVRKLNEVTV